MAKTRLTVYLDDEGLKERLQIAAIKSGKTLSELCEEKLRA